MKRVILVASGQYFDEYNWCDDDFIVAIDGGYDHLVNANIKPHLLVGDFDSISGDIPDDVEVLSLPQEKDDTDSFFAIKECIKRGYKDFELYGFLGNQLSHTIANIQLFLFLKKQGINFKAFYQKQIFQVLHLETIDLTGQGFFSIFSLVDSSFLSIKNCKYQVDNLKMTNDYPIGIDNEFIPNKKASITCHQGYLLLIYNN